MPTEEMLIKYTRKTSKRQAISRLAAYYGLVGANEFVRTLLSTAVETESSVFTSNAAMVAGNFAGKNSALEDIADKILGTQGDGIWVHELASTIEEYCSVATAAEPEMIFSDAIEDDLLRAFTREDEEFNSPISVTLWGEDELLAKKKDGVYPPYLRDRSIQSIIQAGRRAEPVPPAKIGKIIDVFKGAKTRVGVIEFHHPKLAFSNKDTLASAILLQAIPSIEISKCIPFFDCKVIVKGDPHVPKEETENGAPAGTSVFTNGISIYKFLHGEQIEAQDVLVKQLVSMHGVGYEPAMPKDKNDTSPARLHQASFSGMELFTSPQTLVDGDIVHQDLDTTSVNYGRGSTPSSTPLSGQVLDKFRPLMTLSGFDVQVTPATGMLATKSATLKLKLHDKTRLGQIAPLVQSSGLQDVEFLIEWGWSHPDNNPDRNVYGALLDSMRITEKYGIMNSSYTFTKEGQVDITLKLYTKGAANSTFDLVTTSENGEHPLDTMRRLVNSMRAALKNVKKQGFKLNEEVGAPDVMGKLTSVNGLLSLDEEQIQSIEDFIASMKKSANASNSKVWTDVAESLKEQKIGIRKFQEKIRADFKDCIEVITDGRQVGKKWSKPAGERVVQTLSNEGIAANIQRYINARLQKEYKTNYRLREAKDDDGNYATFWVHLSAGGQHTYEHSILQNYKKKWDELAYEGQKWGQINRRSNVAGNNPLGKLIRDAVYGEFSEKVDFNPYGRTSNYDQAYTKGSGWKGSKIHRGSEIAIGYVRKAGWKATSGTHWDSVYDLDPYLIQMAHPDKGGKYVKITYLTHVSLAKLLLRMVALPLAQTKRFDEVQLLFYPMNEYSMFARTLNTGQYPINKSVIKKELLDVLQKSPSMTIRKLLNLIKNMFVNNSGDDIYGISSFYSRDEEGKLALKSEYVDSGSESQLKANKAKFANTKQAVMVACYGEDGEKKFKKPQIHMWVECVKHEQDETQTILRLHFFDKAATSYSSYAQMWQACSAGDLGVIGKYVSQKNHLDAKTKKHYPKRQEVNKPDGWEEQMAAREKRVVKYEQLASSQMDEFIELGLIKPFDTHTRVTDKNGRDSIKKITKFKIAGGPSQIRGILAKNMPTLKYGAEYSGILNASLQTQSNPAMETIQMQRRGDGKSDSSKAQDTGLPMTIKPVTLDLDVFGCPFINFGNQFFVDFQTNTTIDDIYAVTGVQHSLSPTSFQTKVKLSPLNKTGQFKSLVDTFDDATALMGDEGFKLKD